MPDAPPIEIVPATGFDSAALAALFARGYEGYFVPVHLDAAAFDVMVRSGDIDLAASRVALVGGEPTGIAILGVRGTRGWVGGIGVASERRGRGDGRRLMREIIAAARQRGLATLALEVLVQNAPAIPLYESLGFRDTRLLDILARTGDPAADATGSVPAAADVARAGTLPASAPTTGAMPLERALALGAAWQAVPPPWQRERRSIERSPSGLEAIALIEGGEATACAIYRVRRDQLGIALACAAPAERTARLRGLLGALMAAHPGSGFQIINLPAGDPAGEALRALGGRVTLQQREMVLEISAAD